MRLAVTVFTIAALSLGACSQSQGGGEFDSVPGNVTTDPNLSRNNGLIPKKQTLIDSLRAKKEIYEGTPVDQIASVETAQSAGGLIIQVTGLPLRQDAFEVRLINDTGDKPVNGVITYTLKAVQPEDSPQGAEYLRQVNAGVFISDARLRHIKEIRIVGARNQRVIRH